MQKDNTDKEVIRKKIIKENTLTALTIFRYNEFYFSFLQK
jgi:hypothetical protein